MPADSPRAGRPSRQAPWAGAAPARRAAQLGLLVALAAWSPGCGRGARQPTTGGGPEDLLAAARAGDVTTVRRLLDAGIPVDAGNRYDDTALGMASRAGSVELVRLLLERGADPNHRERFFGAAPLDHALEAGHVAIAALLLAGGADDREGALERAIDRGWIDLARAAVESGPLHESRLGALRARAAELDPAWQEILDAATNRPDPPLPRYSPDDLERFAGVYEAQASSATAAVSVEAGKLLLAVGGEQHALEVAGDRVFRSGDGELRASFWGRWGTVEILSLSRGGAAEEQFRLSVAEPAGAAAFRPAPGASRSREPTVHWPGFRGSGASGVGDGIDPPTTWDVPSGGSLRWQVELPGLGHSSPIVWGDRVFVTTAVADALPQQIRTGLSGSGDPVDERVEHRWLVLAFDKRTGRKLWETEIGRDVPLTRRHFKASQASSTPVTDGRRIVAVFPTAGMACLDLDGGIRWRRSLGGLNAGAPGDPGLEWGFASSPLIHRSKVIVQVDVHEGAYLGAWDLDTGRPLWRTERDVVPSWATPSVLPAPGADELIVNGSTIHGYDPETGRELWSLGPNSELVIATPVIGEGVAYVTAGYAPVKPIYAIRAGSRGALDPAPAAGHLLWSQERGGAYMPTPLLYRGLLYVVHHNGVLVAYDARSGTAIFKSRFSRGGTFTASPIAANGKLYVATEEGSIYVLEAGPEYRELAVNDVGEPLLATPAVSEGLLLVRTPRRLLALAANGDVDPGFE